MKCVSICLVLLGASSAQGPTDMEAIQEALGTVSEAASVAYEELLADSPSVAGTVTVSFTISRDGFVGDVAVEGDSVLSPVANVIRTAVSELRFPPLTVSAAPMVISVPFEFKPPEE
jgi:TonB family protein